MAAAAAVAVAVSPAAVGPWANVERSIDMSLIQIEDIYKIYGEGHENEVHALDGVSLEIDSGEFVAIIGSSGSGKSTMMNILGCLDIPTDGDYYLDGVSVRQRTQKELSELRSRRIGFIFQGYNLIPSLNVWQNVALPLTYQGVNADERRRRALEALEKVEISSKAEARPGQLSGGQQQRVAIARALAAKPAIILADEPTGNLDSKTSQEVMGLLRMTSREFDQTVIMITHNEEIAQLADRTIHIEDGKIVGGEQ